MNRAVPVALSVVLSAATLILAVNSSAQAQPVITDQPGDVLVDPNATAQLSLVATSGLAISYQWYRTLDLDPDTPGDDLPVGIDSATLTINNALVADDGYYFCTATDTAGSINSSVARLNVKRLVGHWRLNNDFSDATGNGWTATGNPLNFSLNDAVEGDSYEFNDLIDTNDLIEVTGSEQAFNFYNLGLTVSCWVRTSENLWGAIVSKRTQNPYIGWNLEHNNGHVYFSMPVDALENDQFVESPSGINDAAWHLLTATYDGATSLITLYVDGVQVDQTGPINPFVTSDVPLLFGVDAKVEDPPNTILENYEGFLDDVRIYNHPLDSVQVLTLYNTTGSFCTLSPVELTIQLPGDINKDCKVDILDFMLLSQGWLECKIFPDCVP